MAFLCKALRWQILLILSGAPVKILTSLSPQAVGPNSHAAPHQKIQKIGQMKPFQVKVSRTKNLNCPESKVKSQKYPKQALPLSPSLPPFPLTKRKHIILR